MKKIKESSNSSKFTAEQIGNLILSNKFKIIKFIWILSNWCSHYLNRHFQFGYTENHALLSSIAVWELKPPVLFVLNTKTFKYALVDVIDNRNRMLDIDIDKILNDTRENKLIVRSYNADF